MDAWQLNASVDDGHIEAGLAALLEEAARVRRHGFLATELARAKQRMRAGYERMYAERDKSESDGFAHEYVSYWLTGEPAPGIEMEYAITTRLLDGMTLDEVNALTPTLMHEDSRVVLASAPSTAGAPPTEAALRAVIDREISDAQLRQDLTRHGHAPDSVREIIPSLEDVFVSLTRAAAEERAAELLENA